MFGAQACHISQQPLNVFFMLVENHKIFNEFVMKMKIEKPEARSGVQRREK